MNFNIKNVEINLPNGEVISIETGKLARQANGSVVVKHKNCMILATVVANKDAKEGQDFFPLSVDYQEKFASSGRIPGSFFKREARLNDYEILISRLVDRALRPLFPEDYLCEVQVLITLISSDAEVLPDSLACLAASAALAITDIPIKEIISEVRVAKVNGQLVVNPTRSQLQNASYEFMVAATKNNIMMVEGEAKECSEDDLLEAIQTAHLAIKEQVQAQEILRDKVGIKAKRDYTKPIENEELKEKVIAFSKEKIYQIAKSGTAKDDRSNQFSLLKESVLTFLKDASEEKEIADTDKKLAKKYFEDLKWEVVRNMVLDDRIRLDGRKLDEIRPLAMEIDVLPSPHGSALFTRGETQSLTTVTLGTKLDELLLETAAESIYNKFILHYNFPPFSTGEIKMMRGPGRREVGHGNLAMRSLKKMMPNVTDYPYTIRVVSDILESNGSSSMATVCAGSLALMDAGVPFKKHVSGIAMGLISRQADGKFAVLSDILGDEDHLGDMDFKVTGTKDGICGVQMDIKVEGLSMEIMKAALQQALTGRLHILEAMEKTIPNHKPDLKPHAPRMIQVVVDKEFIGPIIGPGGKIIQEIQRLTGATVTIEEVDNKGFVYIFAKEKKSLDEALLKINGIIAIPEVGKVYDGIVKGIKEFGVFVEFLPGKQGLLHISEIDWKRLDNIEGMFQDGELIQVKLIEVDQKTGKYKLSRKVLIPRN